MNALIKILLVAALVVVAGCVAAPAAYFFVQATGDWWPWLAAFPFHRFFSRSMQVCGVLGAVALVFWLGIRNPRELGIEPNRRWAADAAAGAFAALAPVLVMGAVFVAMDIYRPRGEHTLWPLGRILLTAVAVACVEEFLFRGVLFGLAARVMGAVPAGLAVSVVFAAIHFVRPVKAADGPVDWLSGFREAGRALANWPEWPLWAYGFLTLLVAGVILSWVTWRTRSLALAMGIHAGWIFGQQGLSWFAKARFKAPDGLLPWVGPNLVSGAVPTGLIPLAALGITALCVGWYLRKGCRARGA